MISVIMPVYIQNQETLELTKNSIYSLGDCNLTIVDNDSSIGGGYLRALATTYIRNNQNLGYAKAVNQGIKLSKKKILLVSNNDIKISPKWKDVTMEIMQNEKIGSLHFRMTGYNVPFEYGQQVVVTGKERWCTGSFFVMRNKWLFDENFLNSYDDWDLSYRIRKEGYQTCYTNMACYQHHHSFTRQQIPEREENNKRNREYFKKKHGRYAEDIFAEQYPEQMAVNYPDGFCL
mgnify:CR=1 FL=1